MKLGFFKCLLVLLMFFGIACSAVGGANSVTLIYSGNLDGELEPCGCSEEGDLGGIKRRVTTLDKLRKEDSKLVTISAGGLISSEGVTDRIKSAYILKGFIDLKYDAIGVQWRDLSYGVDFTTVSGLPWIASNWEHENILSSKTITRSINGNSVKFDVFAWLDPDESPMRQMQGEHAVVKGDANIVNNQLKQANNNGSVTVLSTTLPLESVQKYFDLKNVDILFIRASYEVFGKAKQVGNTLVLQPGSRGMRIARVNLEVDEKGVIRKWQHSVIPMPETIADSPRMAAWYDEYNAKVKEDYLKRVEIRKQLETGVSEYVGEEKCKTCHDSQYKVWFDTKHAVAFEALENVNKAFDPACIKCHTVAFNQPGGFVDMSITSHLLGVQCESCHGAGRQHAESAGKKSLANQGWSKPKMCAQCHVQKHSPSFNIDSYWPKIAH